MSEDAPAASVAVEVTGVQKVYGDGLRVLLGRPPSGDSRRALSDASFSVAHGSSLAILGRNGAGKSTLLRLLAGTAQPTSGRIRVRGRIGLLLDLGAGLVEEMTGVDNARAALRLLGLAGPDLDSALGFVADFAEIGSFLDEPVRVYSQGMRLRLAYAAAIAGAPDVLITDEVLAVGDEAFQRKCARQMADFVDGGGSLVLATHNLYLAEKLCARALWLEAGRIRATGPSREVAKAYRDSLAGGWTPTEPPPAPEGAPGVAPPNPGEHGLAVRSAGGRTQAGEGGRPVRLSFDAAWAILVSGGSGPRRLEIDRPDGAVVAARDVGPGPVEISVPATWLLPGRYRLRVRSGKPAGAEESRLWLDCVGERRELGSVWLPHRWGAPPSATGEGSR